MEFRDSQWMKTNHKFMNYNGKNTIELKTDDQRKSEKMSSWSDRQRVEGRNGKEKKQFIPVQNVQKINERRGIQWRKRIQDIVQSQH